jgi:hypothetical protein
MCVRRYRDEAAIDARKKRRALRNCCPKTPPPCAGGAFPRHKKLIPTRPHSSPPRPPRPSCLDSGPRFRFFKWEPQMRSHPDRHVANQRFGSFSFPALCLDWGPLLRSSNESLKWGLILNPTPHPPAFLSGIEILVWGLQMRASNEVSSWSSHPYPLIQIISGVVFCLDWGPHLRSSNESLKWGLTPNPPPPV